MNKSLRIHILEVLGPLVQHVRIFLLKLRGYRHIHSSVIIERGINLDRVFPGAIYIAEGCLIASRATILSHEHVYRDPSDSRLPLKKPVRIEARTFIGVSAVVCPGVTIGSDCIIGAGSVVTKDIPSGSLAVGVPAKVIRSGLKLDMKARLIVSDDRD